MSFWLIPLEKPGGSFARQGSSRTTLGLKNLLPVRNLREDWFTSSRLTILKFNVFTQILSSKMKIFSKYSKAMNASDPAR
jgi:hypothetical protein